MKHLVLLSLTLLIGIYSIMSTPHVYGGDTDTSTCLSGVLSTFRARLRTATTATMADLIADVRSEMRVCTGGSGGSSSVTRGTTSTSSSNGDPGSGLWMPPGMSGVYVVDPATVYDAHGQSIPGGIGIQRTTYPPTNLGVLLMKRKDWYTDPASGKTIDLKPGKILSYRYTVPDEDGVSYISIDTNGDMTNNRHAVKLSVSTIPGDFSNTACTKEANKPTLHLKTKADIDTGAIDACLIAKKSKIYINVTVPAGNRDAILRAIPHQEDGVTHYTHEPRTDGNCKDELLFCPNFSLQTHRVWSNKHNIKLKEGHGTTSSDTSTTSTRSTDTRSGQITAFLTGSVGACNTVDSETVREKVCGAGSLTSCSITRRTPGGDIVEYSAVGCSGALPAKHLGGVELLSDAVGIWYFNDKAQYLPTGTPQGVSVGSSCTEDYFISIITDRTLKSNDASLGSACARSACYPGRIFVQRCR